MKTQDLMRWLDSYKYAWENQDPDTFVKLFTPDCEYRDNPFIEPVPGKQFHAFWSALAKIQQDNHIDLEFLGWTSENRAMVNWQAQSTKRGTSERREGNGVFLLRFTEHGRCSDVLEWQHWQAVDAPLEKRTFFNWQAS